MIQFGLRQLFSLVPLFPLFYAGWNVIDRLNQSRDPGCELELLGVLGLVTAGVTIVYSKGKVIGWFLLGFVPFALFPTFLVFFWPLPVVLPIIGICTAPGAVLASCVLLAEHWHIVTDPSDCRPVQSWCASIFRTVPVLSLYGAVLAFGGFGKAMGVILGFW